MTSCTNNPIIILTRDLLYEYWKKHNKMVDYFLLHDMFELAIEKYPEEWKKVIPVSNSIPHILQTRLFDEYNEKTWKELKRMSSFHKLSYKFDSNLFDKENTFLKRVVL
jgi:hypothetical protein